MAGPGVQDKNLHIVGRAALLRRPKFRAEPQFCPTRKVEVFVMRPWLGLDPFCLDLRATGRDSALQQRLKHSLNNPEAGLPAARANKERGDFFSRNAGWVALALFGLLVAAYMPALARRVYLGR